MALNRYVRTSTVTVAAGTAATPVAGEPRTGEAAGYGNAATASGQGAGLWPVTYLEGTAIVLDPAGALYAAIGSGLLQGVRLDGGPDLPGEQRVHHGATSRGTGLAW
jgi:hypothetical protein